MQGLDVRTIRELIYYRSAELIVGGPFTAWGSAGDGKGRSAETRQVYDDLRTGRWRWSDALRSGHEPVVSGNKCAFCGVESRLGREYVVPKTMKVNNRCPNCETLHGPNNRACCCLSCRGAKGNGGLYSFFRVLFPDAPRFWDLVPEGVEKKYLRTTYACHECAGTLDGGDLDGDGKLTLLDIDQVVSRYAT